MPYCSLQRMIPVYLIVTGSLLILLAALRIYNLWSRPESKSSDSNINSVIHSIEGVVLLAIIIWLILGKRSFGKSVVKSI